MDVFHCIQLFSFLALIVCAWHIALFCSRSLSQTLAYRAAQKERGCQPPKAYHHKDLFGFDLYRERQQAATDGRTVQHYDKIFERLGRTWEERLAEKRIFNTIDPKNIQHVLATGFNDFKKIGQKSSFRNLLGSGIFLSNGTKWKLSRSLIKPTFAKTEISDLDSFGKHAKQFITLLPRDGKTVDVQPLMKKLVRLYIHS